jgi:hypothetical protein
MIDLAGLDRFDRQSVIRYFNFSPWKDRIHPKAPASATDGRTPTS